MTSTSNALIKPVIPFTRLTFALSAALAIIAGIQLYVLTDHTRTFFAWTIAAPLSAAFVGASYWAGALLLLLAMREPAWANIRIAMAAVVAFVPLMVLTTVLHLDRFHLSRAEFEPRLAAWAWMTVYVTVPFILAAMLYFQVRAPGGDPPRMAAVSPAMRALIGVNAVIALVVGTALFLFPQSMASVWPWPLTPLTSRTIGSGFVAVAAGSLQFLREKDWQRTRIGTIPYILIGALHLLALLRYPATVDWSRAGSWAYLLFMIAVMAGGVYSAFVARQSAPATRA
jgi:hypothetical protein